ncbi:hypothetical protein [Schumannella soli]|uniref:PilN domain-containing protein n=1 Tax=Schumannella soli TaxID=2590779 RepID=A0A506XX41_9MICO|nr:hypothetical protein [Schumannella soli]TPW74776.1 hypothetical protein FJ657_14465 [Schumannella soli]
MSVMDILKKDIGGKKKEPMAEAPTNVEATEMAAATVPAPAKGSRGIPAVLSGLPHADLLPPEIGQRHRAKTARRGMRLALVAVVAVAALGIGGAWSLDMLSRSSLAAAQAESAELAAKQAGYKDVQEVQQTIAVGEAAQRVGASVEIDWKETLDSIQAALPAGMTLDTVDADSVSITESYRDGDSPLDSTNVAKITLSLKSSALPSVPDLLNSLAKVKGVVDAQPTSVSLDDVGYTTTVLVHLDDSAFTGRFTNDKKANG